MTTNVFFVRHGRTEWNLEHRLQGANGDSPLLNENMREITNVARKFDEYKIDRIINTGVNRSVHTARLLKDNLPNNPIEITNENFREFDLGIIEGLLVDEANKQYHNVASDFLVNPFQFNANLINAESASKVIDRFRLGLNSIPDGENIIIVSHGAAIKTFLSSLTEDLAVKQDILKGINNLSISQLEIRNKQIKMVSYNEKDFLSPIFQKENGVR